MKISVKREVRRMSFHDPGLMILSALNEAIGAYYCTNSNGNEIPPGRLRRARNWGHLVFALGDFHFPTNLPQAKKGVPMWQNPGTLFCQATFQYKSGISRYGK